MRIVFDIWCRKVAPTCDPERRYAGTCESRERAESRVAHLRTMLCGSLERWEVGIEERTEYLSR